MGLGSAHQVACPGGLGRKALGLGLPQWAPVHAPHQSKAQGLSFWVMLTWGGIKAHLAGALQSVQHLILPLSIAKGVLITVP